MKLLNDLWVSVPFRYLITVFASFVALTLFIGIVTALLGLIITNYSQTGEFNIFLFLLVGSMLLISAYYFTVYFGVAYILLVENEMERRMFLAAMMYFSIGFLLMPILAYNRLVNLHDPKGIFFVLLSFLHIVLCFKYILKLYELKHEFVSVWSDHRNGHSK